MTPVLILHPHAEFRKLQIQCQQQISQPDQPEASDCKHVEGGSCQALANLTNRVAALGDSPLLEGIQQPGIQDVLLRFPRVVSVQRGHSEQWGQGSLSNRGSH